MGKPRGCRRRRHERSLTPKIFAAFGAGILIALFGSMRLALFIAVAALIYVGLSKR